ncbi:MAG: hypothetical protein ABI375_09310 [Rudaea sp.]
MLVAATVALIRLELIRALVLGFLSDSFKQSNGPLQAPYIFLLSMLILLAILFFAYANKNGIVEAFNAITDPDTLKLIGIPMLIMLVDGVINILTFRGDSGRQARLLNTLSNDSAAWLGLMIARVPIELALAYVPLLWFKSDGYAFAAWLPDPDTKLLRMVGWSYTGCYFLGNAVLIAHVYTAHYARTGRGLLDVTWSHWLMRDP